MRLPSTSLISPRTPARSASGGLSGVGVDVIGPAGFDMTDRALKRAGLDYLDHVEIERHASFADFDAAQAGSGRRGSSC